MFARLRFAAFLILPLTVSVARGQIDTDTAINALLHPDPSIRQAAADGLAAKNVAAVEKLVEVMELKHGGTCPARTGAEANMGRRPPSGFAAMNRASCAGCHYRNMRHAVNAGIVLATIGQQARDAATDRLVGILDSAETSDWRWNVTANVLAKLDPAWAMSNEDVLIKGLKRDGPMAQYAAVTTARDMPKWFADKAKSLQGNPNAIAMLESRRKRFVAEAGDALLALLNTWLNPNVKKKGKFTNIVIDDRVIQARFLPSERCGRDDFVILDALHEICVHADEVQPEQAAEDEQNLDAQRHEICVHEDELRRHLFERTGPRFGESTRWEALRRLVDLSNNANIAEEVRSAALQDVAMALSDIMANRYGHRRVEAAQLVGQLGIVDAPTVSALALDLRSADPKLRVQAAQSLAAALSHLPNAPKTDSDKEALQELKVALEECMLPTLTKTLEFEQLRGNPGQAVCNAMQEAIKAVEDVIKAIENH